MKVDMVLTDPPYGTTACKWDSVIPFPDMWARLDKLNDDRTPVCLFGAEPFSSALRMSNVKNYRYDWIWRKNRGSGFLNSHHRPLTNHELISVFSKKKPFYFPVFRRGEPYVKEHRKNGSVYGRHGRFVSKSKDGRRFPVSVIEFPLVDNGARVHPTQKPVALLEYLIKTYTRPGGVVLDFTMGSGSTGVAAVKTGRDFIGIELDPGYFETAQKRIEEEQKKIALF